MTAPLRLSLVSHTNVGKTTLARTLLGRDVGEVRDAPHVTEFAEMNLLLASPEGDRLELWDTPGFGDSVRLVRRLRGRASPIGWFLSQVWDRWRDRAFWASQQAAAHVRERSDVVLYLVNAAEAPEAVGYVGPEMELLGWMGKPVLVLLNQLGAPRAAAEEQADVDRWRQHLRGQGFVADVLPMDAFARCWVQEGALLRAVGRALGDDERLPRLYAAWAAARLATFDAAMAELAASLGRIAAARVALPEGRPWVAEALRLVRGSEASAAQQALADTLAAEVRESTTRLVRLHGLEGGAEGQILQRVAEQVQWHEPVGEGRAALVGGVVTGALAGLKADLLSGGLTLGGGMLAGGLLGALGAAGLARGLNVVRGTDRSFAAWRAEALGPMVEAALLRYLAVAHFGRGRGRWQEGEAPPHWQAVVADALAPEQAALSAAWQQRSRRLENPGEAQALAAALAAPLHAAGRRALQALYPGCWPAELASVAGLRASSPAAARITP